MRVGVPAAPVALQARDPTIAESSKPLGYATGQFGKNQLVDRNEFLPTVHGFDDFFGNLYHLNAEGNRKASTIRSTPASVNGLVRGVLMRRTADTDWPLSRWRSSISRPATDPPLRYSSTAP